jgi:hypothetical protein
VSFGPIRYGLRLLAASDAAEIGADSRPYWVRDADIDTVPAFMINSVYRNGYFGERQREPQRIGGTVPNDAMKERSVRGAGRRARSAAIALMAPVLALSYPAACGADSPALAPRIAAATATAHNNRTCVAARPFYWEIGDQHAALASGTEGAAVPTASTTLPISTASEWIFGAYLVQARQGKLSAADIEALTMRSGYSNLQYDRCVQRAPKTPRAVTVRDCFHAAHLVGGGNSDFKPAQVDKFFYNGGHFQQLAANDPRLADLSATALTGVIGGQLGTASAFSYDSPEPDAGIRTTSGAYAGFLRRILSGQLLIRDQLGAEAVCTNPGRCQTALSTPLPQTENSRYSLGHWVEDDPRVGDGAFSDPGLHGFYPWIDASKTYYGLVGRVSPAPGAHVVSMQCGRSIRKAWFAARVQ